MDDVTDLATRYPDSSTDLPAPESHVGTARIAEPVAVGYRVPTAPCSRCKGTGRTGPKGHKPECGCFACKACTVCGGTGRTEQEASHGRSIEVLEDDGEQVDA